MNKLTGKILWWDERDGHGVVEGDDGLEYYTDVSALKPRELTIKRNLKVTFKLNPQIKNCRCAMEVEAVK